MWAIIDIENKRVSKFVNGIQPQRSVRCEIVGGYPDLPEILVKSKAMTHELFIDKWLDECSREEIPSWELSGYCEVNFNIEPLSLDDAKEKVYEKLAEIRWQKETAGFEFGGMFVPTDREASLIIQSLPDAPISAYKLRNGVWLSDISLETVVALKEAHRAFVQAAFDWEKDETAKVSVMAGINEVAEYVRTNDLQ